MKALLVTLALFLPTAVFARVLHIAYPRQVQVEVLSSIKDVKFLNKSYPYKVLNIQLSGEFTSGADVSPVMNASYEKINGTGVFHLYVGVQADLHSTHVMTPFVETITYEAEADNAIRVYVLEASPGQPDIIPIARFIGEY